MTGPQEPEALWLVLRDALEQRGVSQKQLAVELNRRRPRDGRDPEESWRRTVQKYASPKVQQIPSPEIARHMADILDFPSDYFVRQQRRVSERERLRRENEFLRRRLDEVASGGRSEGGTPR